MPYDNSLYGSSLANTIIYPPLATLAPVNFAAHFMHETAKFPGGNPIMFEEFLSDVGLQATFEDTIVVYRQYLYMRTVLSGLDQSGTWPQRLERARNWLQANDPNNLTFSSANAVSGDNTWTKWTDLILNNYLLPTLGNIPISIGGATAQPLADYPANVKRQFAEDSLNATWKEFIKDYSVIVPTSNTGTPRMDHLSTKLAEFMNTNFVSAPFVLYESNSYEKFYKAFLGDTANFEEVFAKFMTAQGPNFISTTESFDAWTKEVLKQYYANLAPSFAGIGPSSAYGNGDKAFILTRIFSLLVEMVESLQKVAASQSNRLLILGNWQKAYTELQNKIIYVTNQDGRVNADLGNNDDRRNDFNTLNSTYTETIKARKSGVGDDAKNLQTQINQSTDAVNQQTSMATAILQQLAAIFGAIFK